MADIYSTDIVDFVPAVNEAIIIDNLTIVRDPDTGALTALPPSPATYEAPESGYVAPHQHVSLDITNFLASARAALGPGEANQPFFANTAVSNAVVFTYDDLLHTVSADVKIDNLTITKNEYGQLVASGIPADWTPEYVAPHVHISTDITNFILDVRAALGPGTSNQPFFANTATSTAVIFTYDDALKTVSADVKIDNLTIIKNEYGQLVAVSQYPPIDPDYVAPHEHPSTDITDFKAATRAALGPGADNKPFFANTAISNAVVFAYDNTLKTVSADVKIDNNTLVKNKYGQLAATKQIVLAGDIAGLPELIESYVVNATEQALGATAPNGNPWLPEGFHNFTNVKIGDAFYELNKDSLKLRELQETFDKILPAPPNYLNPAIVLEIDTDINIVAYEAGTGHIISISTTSTPQTLQTSRFFKGSTNSGFLTALIDGNNAGRLDPLDPDYSQEGAVNDALIITEDVDAYVDEEVFHGLYRAIRAKISPTTPLSMGPHEYRLEHTIPGLDIFYSRIAYVNVDVPATTMSVQSISFDSIPSIRYASGAPSLDISNEIIISSTTINGVVGYAYGTKVATLTGDTSTIEELDIPAAAIPPAPSYLQGEYGDAIIAPITFYLQDTYNENARVLLTPKNSIGSSGTIRSIYLGRVDNTIEANRVFSGDPTTLYPLNAGETWDSSLSLVAEYSGELQKLNQIYRWPTGNYAISSEYLIASGPDYTDASGVSVTGLAGTWRWVTLKLATAAINRVAFTLRFLGGNAASWTMNPYSHITDGIEIFAKLGNSGWVNANKPYAGYGVADTDGAAAMDVSRSPSAYIKRVTLGPSIASAAIGELFIRVGLPYGSTKQFSDIEISEWA